MKALCTTFSLLILPFLSVAQDPPLKLQAYFNAIIVSDMDASIEWYENALGFEVKNKFESEERGFKQANLKTETIALELIELNSALNPKEVIPSFDSKTRLLGFFKTGFLVSDFDNWVAHLQSKQVDFYGNVVTGKDGKRMAIITDPDGNRIQIFEK